MHANDTPIVIEPPRPAERAVIWLHGLGADGFDFRGIETQLGLPADHAVRFIYPHAPMRPVTINNGYVMRAWYDLYALEPGMREDREGLEASAKIILQLIDDQGRQGIPPEHLLLAGFSQGGAVCLYTALASALPLAGVVALSTYLPVADYLRSAATPEGLAIPLWMAHGTQDPVVPLGLGKTSMETLREMGVNLSWQTYPMPHSLCPEEIVDLGHWLRGQLNT